MRQQGGFVGGTQFARFLNQEAWPTSGNDQCNILRDCKPEVNNFLVGTLTEKSRKPRSDLRWSGSMYF
jgi:hypothetical protein